MASGIQQGYLLLGDISGYTRFLAETELEHAQGILSNLITGLLNRLTPVLTLAEVEGDAVFLFAPADRVSRGETILELVESAYVDFRKKQRTMQHNATCACRACQSITSLDLKFIVHFGEFLTQNISGKNKPMGSPVNVVHRLLKNDIHEIKGWRGYAIFTQDALKRMDIYPVQAFEHTQSYEHLGDIVTHSSNLDERFKELTEEHTRYLENDESDIHRTYTIPAPQPILWDILNDASKRALWMKGSSWKPENRPLGRTGRGAKNHCTNSHVIEHILDWKPFDYSTVLYERGFVKSVMTSALSPNGDGTKLEWRLKMENSLPGWLRMPMGKLLATRLMQWDKCAAEIRRLAIAASEAAGKTPL